MVKGSFFSHRGKSHTFLLFISHINYRMPKYHGNGVYKGYYSPLAQTLAVIYIITWPPIIFIKSLPLGYNYYIYVILLILYIYMRMYIPVLHWE